MGAMRLSISNDMHMHGLGANNRREKMKIRKERGKKMFCLMHFLKMKGRQTVFTPTKRGKSCVEILNKLVYP